MKLKPLILGIILIIARVNTAQSPLRGVVALQATASDMTPDMTDTECGVAYVQFYRDSVAIGPQITDPNADGIYSLTINTLTLANGIYTFTAKAADKAGPNCDGTMPNIGNSAPLTVTIANPPAVVIQVKPAGGA